LKENLHIKKLLDEITWKNQGQGVPSAEKQSQYIMELEK